MSKVVDAAGFIIDIINNQEEGEITNLALNKLLYFAQGLSLAKTGKPLFDNQIEAWKNGPVIQKIFHEYKKYNAEAIPPQKYNIDSLTEDEQDILLETIAIYGKYSASHLVSLTHAPGTPWKNNYKDAKNTPIPQEEIKDYFIKNENLCFYNEKKVIAIDIDRQGRVLLPLEVEEAWGVYDV
jgi:uncharacterized phage-associated protein